MSKGNFTINRNTQIILEGSGLEKSAKFLNDHFKKTVGFALPISKTAINTSKIVLNYERMDHQFPGAYTMEINDKEIYIAGDNEAGVFYGIQTLIQLLPEKTYYPLSIPALSIKDHPRFQYRGMHLDVGRHFFSVGYIKNYIDYLASYKLSLPIVLILNIQILFESTPRVWATFSLSTKSKLGKISVVLPL